MNTETLQKKVEEQVLDSYEAMYRLAYTYVRNEEDALDIVQESVYKAMKGAGSVKGEAYIKTWLWRIVMNTAVDFIRKNRREISVDAFSETGREDIYRDFDTLDALKVLDERERAVQNGLHRIDIFAEGLCNLCQLLLLKETENHHRTLSFV